MNDAAAELLLQQVLDLALAVRDDGPEAVTAALGRIKDPRSALVVAAAAIRIDLPLDCWWNDPAPDGGWEARTVAVVPGFEPGQGSRQVPACGTDSAYHRHKRMKEDACEPCRAAHNTAEVERVARRRQEEAA
jgi:hypothetical protein